MKLSYYHILLYPIFYPLIYYYPLTLLSERKVKVDRQNNQQPYFRTQRPNPLTQQSRVRIPTTAPNNPTNRPRGRYRLYRNSRPTSPISDIIPRPTPPLTIRNTNLIPAPQSPTFSQTRQEFITSPPSNSVHSSRANSPQDYERQAQQQYRQQLRPDDRDSDDDNNYNYRPIAGGSRTANNNNRNNNLDRNDQLIIGENQSEDNNNLKEPEAETSDSSAFIIHWSNE